MSHRVPSVHKLRVYVAGRFESAETIEAVARKLEHGGCEITHEWYVFSDVTQSVCAQEDLRGVATADVVLFLMTDPTHSYRGTCAELGAALALRKPVVMITDLNARRTGCAYAGCVFWHHPDIVKVASVAEGIEKVLEFSHASNCKNTSSACSS